MRELLRLLLRFVLVTLIEALAIVIMARLVPDVSIAGSTLEQMISAVSVAAVLGLLNALIRPLIVLTGLSINLYTVGLFTLILNAGILLLAAFFLPSFQVESLTSALLGSIVLSVVNTFITGLISIDQDYAFYDGVVSWLSRQRLEPHDQTLSRGLVILEIDGLSYQRVQRAIDMGLMPNMKALLDEQTYGLSHVDCGFPSQSSSCQAGIMYGDNYDIPAFRWYDKEQARLFVSNNLSDAAELNQRFFNGHGLLRGGTSINNLLSGEAARSLMTISTLRDNLGDEAPHSGYDLSLVFLNPYLFTRAVVLTILDLLLEFYQATRNRLRNVQPRVNRLNRAYPFLRAATNIFLRDVGTNAVILDVMRGSPAIYTTFMGYDEIAHHAGPDSADALNSLKGFDRSLARILDVVKRRAPRPYDLFVLSDHGQSYGATFRQRTGYTIGEFLESIADGRSSVAEMSGSENVRAQVTIVLAEMERLQGHTGEGQARADVISRASKRLSKRVKRVDREVPVDTDMLVLVGGNLANVYFPQISGKISTTELEQLHPGLLETLLAHPDIGLVITYMENEVPWVIGKAGARNLLDGTLTGAADPLEPYGDPDFRAAQVRRVAEFPHAGDLIIVSAVYDGGQVAAFEEHIGSHGGIGGQQTDAFLFHPADMVVPPTSSTTELYPILNARRGITEAKTEPLQMPSAANPWSLPVMWAGIRDIQGMFSRAARSLRLDRTLFGEVATDPRATGQAVLITFLLSLGTAIIPLASLARPERNTAALISGVIVLMLGLTFCLLLATIAGSFRNIPRSFTRSFNAIAYAGVGGFVAWFAPLEYIGPLLLITGTLIVFVASWLAIQEALFISRWPVVLIPIIAFGLAALILYAAELLLQSPIDFVVFLSRKI